MNILQVTLGYYPAVSWGGPVKIVQQNSKELIRRGHQVTIYCTNLLNKKETIERGTFERKVDGIRVVYFHTWRLPWWPGTLGPIWLPDLGAYLAQELAQFDVVHLNGYRNPMLLQVSRAAGRANVPVVIQPHGAMPVIVNSFAVKKVYDRFLGGEELENLSALIALQESERGQALEHGVPEERIVIIPNGLNTNEVTDLEPGSFRQRFGLEEEQPLILFLGRINKKKGTDMLVEAFSLMDRKLNAQLAIVGPDDGQLEVVRSLIRQHDLEDRVFLTGLLAAGDVPAAFHDADLFVLPCRADTFPTTIMESCQAGTPMVITDRCESAHLVQERAAEVVPFDAARFAEAMENLLSDRERYLAYQENCATIMEDTFSVEAVVDQLESLYSQVVEEAHAESRPCV